MSEDRIGVSSTSEGLGNSGAMLRAARRRRGLRGAVGALMLAAMLSPGLASADEYKSTLAGHPLRLLAYAFHPIGVAIDYIVLRPSHWLVSHEPLKTIFGHLD